MAISAYAGMTDYSHQSLGEIIKDLNKWKNQTIEVKAAIETKISQLESHQYWPRNVYHDFVGCIYYINRFFQTVIDEIDSISSEIETVRSHHITRLFSLSKIADEQNRKIGLIWNNEYRGKDYGNSDFREVENIYAEARDLVAGLQDMSNIASRLKDFIVEDSRNSTHNTTVISGSTFGSNTVVTTGNNNTVKTKSTIQNSDLKIKLLDLGISEEDSDELVSVINTESFDKEKQSFGPKVSQWVGKMVSKAAQGLWDIKIEAAGSLLAELIKAHYGLFQ